MTKAKITFRKKIEHLPVIKQIIDLSKAHSFPGFREVSIYKTFYFLVQEARRNDLNMRASAMTYHFFMALFPFVIFLFTLTAYLPQEWDFYKVLEQSLISLLPEGAEEYIITDIIDSLRPKANSSFLSIGFILAIYFGSEGILAMMRGFDKTYKTNFRKRKWWATEITAVILTFAVGLLLILSILSVIFGEKILIWFLDYVHLDAFTKIFILLLKYFITLILFYVVIDLVYRHGPANKKPMKGWSPGVLFATVSSIITSMLFALFIDKFSTYHKIYGAISALIITLIWIRLNAMILIMGFDLNAAITVDREMMSEAQLQKTLLENEMV